MSRHRANAQHTARTVVTVVVAVAAVVTVGTLLLRSGSSPDETTAQAAVDECDSTLKVVSASSFAPVLTELTPVLAADDPCVSLQVEVADGRVAAGKLAELGAHVWIPDDAAWAGVAADGQFAEQDTAGSGTVLATSPIYMIADPPTGERVEAAGASWLGLADLLASGSGLRLAVRDPAGSGDGLIAAGAVGEAVWVERGMDESA